MKQLELAETATTTPRKLHRRGAPGTSVAAAHKVDQVGRAQLVLNEIKAAGESGITVKEIAAKHPDVPYPSISARPAALAEAGLIYYKGDTRSGARLMRLTEKALSKVFG